MENKIQYVIPLGKDKPKNVTLVPNDPGSRYKCRQLQVQVIGKSKMIKTVLVNILDVAKDMQVPPAYVGVYMGYDIGAQAKFDPKKPERQQAFLSGEHQSADLGRIMQQFIQEFVLCSVCGLPELLITVDKNQVLQTCRACGHHGPMNIVNEKFKRHVINHPPSGTGFAGNKAGAKKEAKTRKDKDKKKGDDDDDEEQEDEAPAEKTKSKSKSRKQDNSDDDEDNIEWFSDTSKEAQMKRRLEMLPETILTSDGSALPGAAPGSPELKADKRSTSPAPEETKPQNGGVAPSQPAAAASPSPPASDASKAVREAAKGGGDVESLKKVKKEHSLGDAEFVRLLFDALFPANTNLKKESAAKKALLSKLVTGAAAQTALLDCIEQFCAITSPAQLDQCVLIVKELYDLDLLEEDVIIQWHTKPGANAEPKVRKQLAPLVQWLQEDDDEDEDEEEEEGEGSE